MRILIAIGVFLIVSGIFLNEWFFASWFSADGDIALPHRIIIWIIDLGLIIAGLMAIKFHGSVKKGTLLAITGLLLILAGVLFFGKFLTVVMDTFLSDQNRVLLKVVEVFFIATGLMAIIYRKSLDLKTLMLFGTSSLLCFTLFLGFDYYRSYSGIVRIRSYSAEHAAENLSSRLIVKDNNLGWKLKANSMVKHSEKGKPDATYLIDENGLRKINNTKKDPDFSIYFFGDSFTLGSGVNNGETFTDIIKDRYLKEEINVYNAGVMGYGIVQMFQRFLDMKDRIKQDDLVIFTPLSEDITRNLTDFQFPYFIKLTNIADLEYFPFFDGGAVTSRKFEDNFYNRVKLVALSARYTGNILKYIRSKFIPDSTKESVEMIKIAERETKLRGGKFVLIFLPKPFECSNRSYAMDISRFDYLDIRHFFPSEESEVNKLRINSEDGHWNIRGHEIAAKAIVETLVENRIIDEQYLRQN